MTTSLRSPSASRRTFCAPRPSSQNPDSWVSASMSATRASLASRSKMPRGRPDPFSQFPDGGGFHLVPGLEILEQDRAQFDETQRGLASGDYGVHAGAIGVVRADAAVSVAIEGCRVTARPAVPLTGDQIDERCFLGLLHGLPFCGLGKGRLGTSSGSCHGSGGARCAAGFGTVYGSKAPSPRGNAVRVAWVVRGTLQEPPPTRKYCASAPSS